MNRTPPKHVRQQLRREVGFGCPVDGCGNPYLYWHHFDPPWRERNHHDPDGMIAICADHHAAADAGAFTKEQLHTFKDEAARHRTQIAGRFNWLRDRLLVVVGGVFFYETPIAVALRDQPVVWLNRDEDQLLTLNIAMPTTPKEPRMRMEDNFWLARGNLVDFECPPSGRLIHGLYPNGDELKVEFRTLQSPSDVSKRYPFAEPTHWNVDFPIAAAEVMMRFGNVPIDFGPTWTNIGGGELKGAMMYDCRVGIALV